MSDSLPNSEYNDIKVMTYGELTKEIEYLESDLSALRAKANCYEEALKRIDKQIPDFPDGVHHRPYSSMKTIIKMALGTEAKP